MNDDTKNLILSTVIMSLLIFQVVPITQEKQIHPIDGNNQFSVGLVNPVFTYTAYKEGNFYDYFHCVNDNTCENAPSEYLEVDLDTSNIPHYLNWFNFHFNDNNFGSAIDNSILELSSLNTTFEIISDLDVHYNNISQYNLLIFFHNEYVTIKEFDNTIDFIKNGGNVIIMNGNAFYAEITYHEDLNTIQLIEGHSVKYFENNDSYVYDSEYYYRFYDQENIESSYAYKYIGSKFSVFNSGSYNPEVVKQMGNTNLTSTIASLEENTVINQNVNTIVKWNSDTHNKDVQTYEYYPFENDGRLIHMGLYSTYFLNIEDFENFIIQLIIYQLIY